MKLADKSVLKIICTTFQNLYIFQFRVSHKCLLNHYDDDASKKKRKQSFPVTKWLDTYPKML